MRISEQYYSIKNNILFCVAVPLFVMLFMVIYQPLFYGEAEPGTMVDVEIRDVEDGNLIGEMV